MICDQCGQQTLTPGPGPGHYSTVTWSCAHCHHSKYGSEIAPCLDTTWNKLQENVWADLDTHHQILQDLVKLFGDRHYYSMEVKRRVLDLIGSDKHEYNKVSEDLLLIKMRFCEDHLEVQKILSPGLTEYRAYISLHYAETLYQLVTRFSEKCNDTTGGTCNNTTDNTCNNITGDTCTMMTRAMEHLETVIRTWQDYRQGSSERQKTEHAQHMLDQIRGRFCDILDEKLCRQLA